MIDRFVQSAARIRRKQRVALPPGPVKVNVGAGIEVAEGWINIDGSLHALAASWPRPLLSRLYKRASHVRRAMDEAEYIRRLKNHRFIFHDLSYGLPFDERTVDFVFCSHVLEHFYRADAEKLVHEIHRVLKPGGRVRIAVPDLEHAVSLYQQGQRTDALEFFFTESNAHVFSQHRYMYDYELMRTMLLEHGFADVTRCAYREGGVPDLELLDNRPEQSLYVEGVRP